MSETGLLLPLASLLAALVIGAGLWFLGGSKERSWAVPVGAAIFAGGLGWAYELPGWLTVGAFLAIPFFFHRGVRKRQEKAARSLLRIDTEPPLRLITDPAGSFAAVWTTATENPREQLKQALKADHLVFGLQFADEADDEFSIHLRSEVERARPGVLFLHHRGAQVRVPEAVKTVEPITGLPGQTPDIVVRAVPGEYAFRMLDIAELSSIAEMLRLRGPQREIYVELNGSQFKIAANATFETEELKRLIIGALPLVRKMRAVAAEETH